MITIAILVTAAVAVLGDLLVVRPRVRLPLAREAPPEPPRPAVIDLTDPPAVVRPMADCRRSG